jgi:hypothetical protein
MRLEAACLEGHFVRVSPSHLDGATIRTLASFRCLHCDSTWQTEIHSVVRNDKKKSGCPACAARRTADKNRDAGRARLEALCAELGYEIESEYRGLFEPVVFRCAAHADRMFRVSPSNLRGGQRCPSCSGNPQDHVIGDVVAAYERGTTWKATAASEKTTISFACTSCGETKSVTWVRVRETFDEGSTASRQCACQRYGEPYAAFVRSLGEYELLEPYRTGKTPVLHRHKTCGTEWRARPDNFQRDEGGVRCPACARLGRASRGQLQLLDFVRGLAPGVQSDFPGLMPESPRVKVDMYIPERGVAIDFDGVWWHSEGRSRERWFSGREAARPGAALEKTRRLADLGVQLIRVYSDEWAGRRSTVESRLRAILCRPLAVFDARKTTVDAFVPAREARAFLDANHLQGSIPLLEAAVGLRGDDGLLLALATFGERAITGGSAGRQLELLRFCTVGGSVVRGALGRIIAAFRRSYDLSDHEELVTYADLRWTPLRGSRGYELVGFRLERQTKVSYDYVHKNDSNKRLHRSSLQRHKLLAMEPSFDASMTEWQMAQALGYARLWDCGQLRYVYKLK